VWAAIAIKVPGLDEEGVWGAFRPETQAAPNLKALANHHLHNDLRTINQGRSMLLNPSTQARNPMKTPNKRGIVGGISTVFSGYFRSIQA